MKVLVCDFLGLGARLLPSKRIRHEIVPDVEFLLLFLTLVELQE